MLNLVRLEENERGGYYLLVLFLVRGKKWHWTGSGNRVGIREEVGEVGRGGGRIGR